MRFSLIFQITILASVASSGLGLVKTPTKLPVVKHELIKYLDVVNVAAVELKDALQKAVDTPNVNPRKMDTEAPIFKLAFAMADTVAVLRNGTAKINNYAVIYNGLEKLSTSTYEVSDRIIKLNSAFVKYDFVPVITTVLGLFVDGFNQLYMELVKISGSSDPGRGKFKRTLPTVVADTICTLDMAFYVLDPARATLTKSTFCDKSGKHEHPAWSTLPKKAYPGLDDCHTEDTGIMACALEESRAFTIESRKPGWCKCSTRASVQSVGSEN